MLIKSLKLENFKGIQKLGKKIELKFDTNKKEIILIKGENGFGKTTILESLHPFPYMLTRDIKSGIKVYPAKKIIEFYKEDILYKGEIIWEDNKTTKGFLYQNNELIKATEKGNITEYIYQIELLFDKWEKFKTSVFLKQGVLDIINAKPSERLNIINKFMPNLEQYDKLKTKFSEKEKELKVLENSLKEDLNNIEKFEDKYNKVLSMEKIYNEKTLDITKKELSKIEKEFITFTNINNNIENKKNFIKQLEDDIEFINSSIKELNNKERKLKQLEKKIIDIDILKLEEEKNKLLEYKQFNNILIEYNFTFNKYKKIKEENLNDLKVLIDNVKETLQNKKRKEELQIKIDKIKFKIQNHNLENLSKELNNLENLLNKLENYNIDISNISKLNKQDKQKKIEELNKDLNNNQNSLKNLELDINNINIEKDNIENILNEIQNNLNKYNIIKENLLNKEIFIDTYSKITIKRIDKIILLKNISFAIKMSFEELNSILDINNNNLRNLLKKLEKENIDNVEYLQKLNTNNYENELENILNKGNLIKEKIAIINNYIEENKNIKYKDIDFNKIKEELQELEEKIILVDNINLIKDTCPICKQKISKKHLEDLHKSIKDIDNSLSLKQQKEELENLLRQELFIKENNKKYLLLKEKKEELDKLELERKQLLEKYKTIKKQQEEYYLYKQFEEYSNILQNYKTITEIQKDIENNEEIINYLKQSNEIKLNLDNLYKNINNTLNIKLNIEEIEDNIISILKHNIELKNKTLKNLNDKIISIKNNIININKQLKELNQKQEEYHLYKQFEEYKGFFDKFDNNIKLKSEISNLKELEQDLKDFELYNKQLENLHINKQYLKYNLEEIENKLNFYMEIKNFNIDKEILNIDKKLEKLNNKIEEYKNIFNEIKFLKDEIDKNKNPKEQLYLKKETLKITKKELEKLIKNKENILLKTEEEYDIEKQKLQKWIEEYNKFIIEKNDIEKLYKEYKEKEEKLEKIKNNKFIYNTLKNTSDKIKKTIIANTFDNILKIANLILSNEGTIKLQIAIKQTTGNKFSISVLDLMINEEISDISELSGAEKMVVQKALSIALAANTNFKTLWIDESDGMLSKKNRNLYISLLKNIFNILDIEEIFIISHNEEVVNEADQVIDLNNMVKFNY